MKDFQEFDSELKTEFGIVDDLALEGDVTRSSDQPDLSKKGFVTAQIEQLQVQVFRLRCEIYANYAVEAETDEEKLGRAAKIKELRAQLKVYAAQLAVYEDIFDALNA